VWRWIDEIGEIDEMLHVDDRLRVIACVFVAIIPTVNPELTHDCFHLLLISLVFN
jgi:hypothetical protein